MEPNPLDLPPDVDAPHTWCNFMTPEGAVWQTLHTRDDWAYCLFLRTDSNGAMVIFFKRTLPVVFTPMGAFREGLERIEESFAKWGLDIPAWAAWIQRYHIMAQSDAAPDPEAELNGLILGGPWSPFYQHVEQFYASHPAWEHA